MPKKILAVLLVLGLLAGAVSMAAADDKVTVKFWSGSLNVDFQKEALTIFERLNPGIKVENEFVPMGNVADKVTLAAAADALPNVLLGYAGRSFAFYFQGLTEPLEVTLTQEEIDNFVPGVLDIYTIDGTLTSFPVYHNVIIYSVNRTLLEDAGCSELLPENREITLDTWTQIAEKTSNLPGIYPSCLFAKGKGGDYYMLQYFQMFGANQYEGGDYTQTTLNSDAGVRALEWMLEVVEKGWSPPGTAGMNSQDYSRWMTSGKIVLMGGSPAQSTIAGRTNYFDNGFADQVYDCPVTQTPHVEGVPVPGLFPSPTNVVVFKGETDSAKREAAITLAKFFLSQDFMDWILGSPVACLPTQRGVTAAVEFLPAYQFTLDMLAEVGIADLGMASPHYLEVRLARFPELQAAFMGIKTPREALDDFAKAVADMWK